MTTLCPHAHEVVPYAEQCGADGPGLRDVLCCWLKAGHDGDHWDVADKVHWRQEPGLRYAIEVRCTDGDRIFTGNGD